MKGISSPFHLVGYWRRFFNFSSGLFGDRGYISKKLTETLKNKRLEIITTLKKNMKKILLTPLKKCFLKNRGVVKIIIDQLKNLMHIDHTRHRSPPNFQVNLLYGLLAYVLKPRKPSVPFSNLNNLSLSLRRAEVT
mgnify:FL=1|tara:strand:- start:1581 stop:1988 length:408 start_codon:yes stop_codon:yes gene_type:complete